MNTKFKRILSTVLIASIFFACDKSSFPMVEVNVEATEGGAVVTWEKPKGSAAEVVYYGLKGENIPLGRISGDAIEANTAVISDLENGQEHTVKIYAVSAAGMEFFVGEKTFTPVLDTSLAEQVMAQIKELPTNDKVELSCEDDVKCAREAYELLKETHKCLVLNIEALEKAEQKIAWLKAEEADRIAAGKVNDMIEALPDAELATGLDRSDFEVARDAYNFLTKAQKDIINDLAKLNRFAELFEASYIVEVKIDELPALEDLKITDTGHVNQVFVAYENLEDLAKNLVDQEMKDKLFGLKLQYVVLLIEDLPEVAEVELSDKDKVRFVKDVYNTLDEDDKIQVSNRVKLLEASLVFLEKNLDAVIDGQDLENIKAIKEVYKEYRTLDADVDADVIALFEEKTELKTKLEGLIARVENLTVPGFKASGLDSNGVILPNASLDEILVEWESVAAVDGYTLYYFEPDLDSNVNQAFSEDLATIEFSSKTTDYTFGSADNRAKPREHSFWIKFFVEIDGQEIVSSLSSLAKGARNLTDEEWVREVNLSIYTAFSEEIEVFKNEDETSERKSFLPLHKPGDSWSDNSYSYSNAFGGKIKGYNANWAVDYGRGYVFENITPRYLTINGLIADLMYADRKWDLGKAKYVGDKPRYVRISARSNVSGTSEFLEIGGVYAGEFRYHMHIDTEHIDSAGGAPPWIGETANGVCGYSSDCTRKNTGADYFFERKAAPKFNWTHNSTPYQIKRAGEDVKNITNTPEMWDFHPDAN